MEILQKVLITEQWNNKKTEDKKIYMKNTHYIEFVSNSKLFLKYKMKMLQKVLTIEQWNNKKTEDKLVTFFIISSYSSNK